MKKEEIDFLGLKKRAEGKGHKEIKKELMEIEMSCKAIKSDKRLIRKQETKIRRLEKEINAKNKEIFKLRLKLDQKNESK